MQVIYPELQLGALPATQVKDRRRLRPEQCHFALDEQRSTDAGQRYFMENHLMDSCLQYAEGATSMALSIIGENK